MICYGNYKHLKLGYSPMEIDSLCKNMTKQRQSISIGGIKFGE